MNPDRKKAIDETDPVFIEPMPRIDARLQEEASALIDGGLPPASVAAGLTRTAISIMLLVGVDKVTFFDAVAKGWDALAEDIAAQNAKEGN